MNSWNQPVRGTRLARCLSALLMLGLFLGVQWLAASHTLHESLHAEAGHAEHQCVVTAVEQGQLQHVAVLLAVVPPSAVAAISFAPVEISPVRAPSRLLAGRAPPVLA